MITKEQAIDILDKFDFFQGQRAGRELWNDKPYDVQEEDIKAFSRDVAELKAYIADVVPKSEGWWIYHEDRCSYICSACEHDAPDNYYGEPNLTDFCPNCGAKMKGGVE